MTIVGLRSRLTDEFQHDLQATMTAMNAEHLLDVLDLVFDCCSGRAGYDDSTVNGVPERIEPVRGDEGARLK